MKILKLTLIVLIIFLISIQYSFALGVSPGILEKIVENPSEPITGSFNVNNKNIKPMDVKIIVQGEFAEYVIIEGDEEFTIIPFGKKTVSYTVNLPENLEPGTKSISIGAREVLGDVEGAFIAAETSFQLLKLKVPFPGKYAEVELLVGDTGHDKDYAQVTLIIKNLGTDENDLPTQSTLKVFNPKGDLIRSSNIGSLDIPHLQSGYIWYEWDINEDTKPGKYIARVETDYGNGLAEDEDDFKVGTLDFTISELNDLNLTEGSVARFPVRIESHWDEEIPNPVVEISIKNEEDVVIFNKQSFSGSIVPFGNANVETLWDTNGIPLGTYQGQARVFYKDIEKIDAFTINIVKKPLEINKRTTAIIFSLVISLIVIIFLYFTNKKVKGVSEKNINKQTSF